MRHQCNDLLITYANFLFGNSGYQKMNLGGGLKIDEKDGLSSFKKKYSTIKKTFYITKLLCDEKKYLETRKSLNILNKSLFLIGDAIKM